MEKNITIPVTGMTCANCAMNIERTLKKKKAGVVDAAVNFAGERVRVEFLPSETYIPFETSAVIITLIKLGKMLEARTKGRTGAAIRKLMGLSPKTAVVLIDGKKEEVPLDKVKVGDLLLVRPGQSIPVDGAVVFGEFLQHYLDSRCRRGWIPL
jgi:cation transport ATPase